MIWWQFNLLAVAASILAQAAAYHGDGSLKAAIVMPWRPLNALLGGANGNDADDDGPLDRPNVHLLSILDQWSRT